MERRAYKGSTPTLIEISKTAVLVGTEHLIESSRQFDHSVRLVSGVHCQMEAHMGGGETRTR